MNTAILIALSLIYVIASFTYLVWKELNGDTPVKKLKNAVSRNKKILIYSIIVFAVLVGMSVFLSIVYTESTLIHNMKMITLLAILATVTVTDIKEQKIPNKVVVAGLLLRVAFAVAEFATMGAEAFLAIAKDALYSLILVAVLFVLGVLLLKGGIGMGDIKLMAVMGLFQGITGVISSLFLSLLVIFVLAIIMLITKKKQKKDSIEFAPSVMVGTLASIILTGI